MFDGMGWNSLASFKTTTICQAIEVSHGLDSSHFLVML